MNVFSCLLARAKYAFSLSDGANDFSRLISLNKNRPFSVRTLDSTVYSQFLKSPPDGHEVMTMESLVMLWILWPVVASFKFIGSWCILYLNSSCVVAWRCGLTLTLTVVVFGSNLNRRCFVMRCSLASSSDISCSSPAFMWSHCTDDKLTCRRSFF